MKVSEVLNYNRIIKSIIDDSKDVNALVKFKLLGICKQFEPVVANFEIVRNDKIAEFGTLNEVGEPEIIPPKEDNFSNKDDYQKAVASYKEAWGKFSTALDEILNSDVDVEIKKFKYMDIIDAGIPASYLVAIYDLIEE